MRVFKSVGPCYRFRDVSFLIYFLKRVGGLAIVDDPITHFYTTNRKNYDGPLSVEIQKYEAEIREKGMLYHIIKEIKKLFPDGIDRVLDVGGGIGAKLYVISRYVKINEAYSVDLYVPPQEIQQQLPNIKFLKCSAYDLSKMFRSNYFDFVLLSEVIEHLFDPDTAIAEIKNVMKDNGILIISTPNLSSFVNRILLLLGYQPLSTEVSTHKQYGRPKKYNLREGVAGHIRVFTFRALNEFLKDNGFQIIASYTTIFTWPNEYKILRTFEKFIIMLNKSLGSRILVVARK